jgi:formate C-acetyltransferase
MNPLLRRLKQVIKSLPAYEYLRPQFEQARFVQCPKDRTRQSDTLLTTLLTVPKVRVMRCPRAPAGTRAAEEFLKLCQSVRLRSQASRFFFYSLDPYTVPYQYPNRVPIGNVTVDYGRFLENGFASLEDAVHLQLGKAGETPLLQSSLLVLQGLHLLSLRIRENVGRDPNPDRRQCLLQAFMNMEDFPAGSFHEALQRLLFVNQILWQCHHSLNGLGRVDQLLLPYYLRDRENGRLDRSGATEMLKDFLVLLHHDFHLKSATYYGDTGQIIVIGGTRPDGEDASNELTELLLSAVGSLHQPDPKLLFRVSSKTPRQFIDLAVECLRERTGSPLFCNDEVVIPALIQFGFPRTDALNYATAACWEPLVPGRSLDQGNVISLNFLLPLLVALDRTDHMDNEADFERLLEQCESALRAEVERLPVKLDEIQWQPSPFMSLFMDGCLSASKDISAGGAVYNNYGITTLAMGNLVDSLLNIRKLIVQQQSFSLQDLKDALRNDFIGSGDLLECLRAQQTRYGCDDSEVVALTNRFTLCAATVLRDRRNRFGGQFKLGLSSPSYLTGAVGFPASPDGRRTGEPFYVHISSDRVCSSPTDLVRFSGHLEYNGHRFNGNVVDFVLDPKLVESYPEKFGDFLEGAISSGFFQMQMTVVDSAMLRAAIEDPDKFPNLIVRVWGFSAYFRDLPMEYKQLVLERTLRSEAAGR